MPGRGGPLRGSLSSALVDFVARRVRLESRFPDLGVDAFLVTRLPNVRFLTGFTGSNGQLLLAADGGVFLTDGRYAEQSRHEVPDLQLSVYSGDIKIKAVLMAQRNAGSGNYTVHGELKYQA